MLLYIDFDSKSNISVTVLGEIDAVYPVLDQNYYYHSENVYTEISCFPRRKTPVFI